MKKVILAENVRTTLEKEGSFLDRSDVRIFPVSTNRQALELHRDVGADLIISNLDSPDMDGETLCATLREDDKLRDVSVIIVSSRKEADLARCLDCRANAFVTTPINGPVLLQEAYQLLHVAHRSSFRVPLRVKLHGAAKKASFMGFVENISASGMLFRTSALLFEGDMVKCTFSLPGRKRISADAEVVRILPKKGRRAANGYGVRFVDSGSSAVALDCFIGRECEESGQGVHFPESPAAREKQDAAQT